MAKGRNGKGAKWEWGHMAKWEGGEMTKGEMGRNDKGRNGTKFGAKWERAKREGAKWEVTVEIITYLDDLVVMAEYSNELQIEQLWSLLAELIYILSHENY
jgi:hypothetical protein